MNAVKHGLAAQSSLLPGECPEALARLALRVAKTLRPRFGIEEVLAQRVVALSWKLRRVARAEAAQVEKEHRDRIDTQGLRMAHGLPWQMPDDRDAGRVLADTFARDDAAGPLSRIAAYEERLTGQLLATLRQLDRHRAARAKWEREDADGEAGDEAGAFDELADGDEPEFAEGAAVAFLREYEGGGEEDETDEEEGGGENEPGEAGSVAVDDDAAPANPATPSEQGAAGAGHGGASRDDGLGAGETGADAAESVNRQNEPNPDGAQAPPDPSPGADETPADG